MEEIKRNQSLNVSSIDQGTGQVGVVCKGAGIDGNSFLEVSKSLGVFARAPHKPPSGGLNVPQGQSVPC